MEHKLTLGSYIYRVTSEKIEPLKIVCLVEQDEEIKIGLNGEYFDLFYNPKEKTFRNRGVFSSNNTFFTYAEATFAQKKLRQETINRLYNNMINAQNAYHQTIKEWLYTEFIEEKSEES